MAYFCKDKVVFNGFCRVTLFLFMPLNPNKNLKLYYSIGEVADLVGVTESLLRFWEKEFPEISPKRAGRGVRQYTDEDVDRVRLVYHLVKVRGMKLAAAHKALKNNKEGLERDKDIVERLGAVRAELMSLKKAFDTLV